MTNPGEISKSQIDRLGDRLRTDAIHEEDLRLLDFYRRSFRDAYEEVIGKIREQVDLEITGRPAKSITSIADKLRRESIRLSQIQDIAGLRLVVEDLAHQDDLISQINHMFTQTTIVDRRANPSHGYRAVHLIVVSREKLIEVQVRTALQHMWAESSEKLSDIVDSAIKYGGGDAKIVDILASASDLVAKQESSDAGLQGIEARLRKIEIEHLRDVSPVDKETLVALAQEISERKQTQRFFRARIVDVLGEIVELIPQIKSP
jgi:putative GTP pyrophosphokinase